MTEDKSGRESPGLREAAPQPGGSASNVVVLLPDQVTARACLDLGEAAALAVGGAMRAVHIGADPMAMLGSAEEMDIQLLREASEGTANERLARIRGISRTGAGKHPAGARSAGVTVPARSTAAWPRNAPTRIWW